MTQVSLYEHQKPGLLITFCGLDGCGKSTMIAMLAESLAQRGTAPLLTKQPTDFVRKSEIFRTYMDRPDHAAYDYRCLSLIAAGDRIQHSNKVILPALEKGDCVLSDRYFYSCIANLHARGYTEDQWIYEVARQIPKPDLAFFLDVPVPLAIERVRERKEERDKYIDLTLQYKLRQEYLDLAQANGGFIIPSSGAAEENFRNIKKIVEKYLEEKKWIPLKES